MVSAYRVHQWLGLILVIPFFAWIATGVVFLIKPGYGAAYEKLSVQTYPVTTPFTVPFDESWQEARLLKTRLGEHLLVRVAGEWRHFSARTMEVFPEPSEPQLRLLIDDAIAVNPSRYGNVVSYDDGRFITDTRVQLTLDWFSLSLRQRGADTRLISTLYKVHYLEWLPWPKANLALGVAGLLGLLLLVIYGLVLFFKERPES